MKNADVILLLEEKLPEGHLVDWYETINMILQNLPGEPEFDIVEDEFIVTTGDFAAAFKPVSDGIEIKTLTSFGDKPSGYRMTVPNDLKLVKALEALYNRGQSPDYKPNEVSSLDRYYFSGADTMSTRRQKLAAPPYDDYEDEDYEDDDDEEGTYYDGDCDSEHQQLAEQAVEESNPRNIPDFAYFGDLPLGETWAYTISTHRDADLLTQSNWEVIKEDMESRFPEDVTDESASHWAVGWVDKLAVRMLDDNGCVTPAGEAIIEWKNALDDYPVADESHFSEKEWNYAMESLPEDVEWTLRDEEFEDMPDDGVAQVIQYMLDNESSALDYVLEDPMNHSIEGHEEYAEEVKEIARELGLDWLSRNKEKVLPFLQQVAREEPELSAEELADLAADEFGVEAEQLDALAEMVANPVDPRQERLPLEASAKRRHALRLWKEKEKTRPVPNFPLGDYLYGLGRAIDKVRAEAQHQMSSGHGSEEAALVYVEQRLNKAQNELMHAFEAVDNLGL